MRALITDGLRSHSERAVEFLHRPRVFVPHDRDAVFASMLAHHRTSRGREILDLYLEGWAEADPQKLAQAAAPSYRFDDPVVGTFTRRTLPRYFEILRARFTVAGASRRSNFGFLLYGIGNECRLVRRQYQFWREAPHIGLSGSSDVKLGLAA